MFQGFEGSAGSTSRARTPMESDYMASMQASGGTTASASGRAPAAAAPFAYAQGYSGYPMPWAEAQPLRGQAPMNANPFASFRSGGLENLTSYLNSYYGQGQQQYGSMGYHGWPSQAGSPGGMGFAETAFANWLMSAGRGGPPHAQQGGAGMSDPFLYGFSSALRPATNEGSPEGGEQEAWDPVSAGFPEAFRDPRFREIANRYAAVSEDWRDGGRHWDPRSLQEATRRALMTFQGKTAQEIENMVGEWGIEGASGRQWLDDLNWMAEHLGMDQGQYARWTDHTRQFKADPLGEAHRAAHVMPQSRDALHENPYFKTIAEKYVAIDPRWRDMGKGWDTGELADWVAHQVKHFTSTPRHELEREAQQMGLRGFDVDQWGRDLGFLRQALAPLLDEDRASEWRMLGVGAPLSSHIPRFNVMYPDPPAQLLRSGGGVGVTQSPGRSSGFGLR